MSASDTGESLPLVQCFSAALNVMSARSPASWTALASSSRIRLRSDPGNGQTLDPHRRRVGSVAEFEIIGGRERAENIVEVTGNRHLADRIGQFAALDPKTGSAAAVIAGDDVDAHANQVSDVEPVLDVSDQFFWRDSTSFKVEVRWAGRWRR